MANESKHNWYWWAIGITGTVLVLGVFNRKRVVSNLKSMQLTKNFNLSEFVVTSTGFDNIPGPVEKENLKLLAEKILQPLRDYLGKSVIINSAYRSELVNKAVGGAATSQHKSGQAADIHIPGMTNQQIIDAIRKLNLPYDQLIDEQLRGKNWVHVSYNKNGGRKQWLTARDGAGGSTIYTTVKYG